MSVIWVHVSRKIYNAYRFIEDWQTAIYETHVIDRKDHMDLIKVFDIKLYHKLTEWQ